MFSIDQQRLLGLRNATAGTFPVSGRPAPGCTWITDTDLNYNAQTIPVGAEAALSDTSSRVLEVNRFGAVQSSTSVPGGNAPLCQVVIDAAPGQALRVQVLATPGGRPYSNVALCRLATDAASMVMTTVVGAAR